MSKHWIIFDAGDYRHIIPHNDEKPHASSMGCECTPQLVDGTLVVHSAFDCRELIEQAEAIKESVA